MRQKVMLKPSQSLIPQWRWRRKSRRYRGQMSKPFKIGDIQIDTPILLAPMAGVTDYSFRILCKEQGAGIVYSEFVSAHGIIRENDVSLNIIKF